MKCTKVKNPCKICFEAVTKKNGLQCQGACHKWAHFKCLNYTPGKIQDIKAGIIKVTCPCPDCNTFEPKEVLADPPFTCTNTKCPANKLPVCESQECPNKENPIPTYPPPPFEYSSDSSRCSNCPSPRRTSSPKRCPSLPVCPPARCHKCPPSPPPVPKCPPPMPKCPPPKPKCSPPSPKCPPPTPKCPPPTPKCPPPPPICTPPRSQSPACPNPMNCPPSCKPICPPTCPSYQNMKKGKKCCSPKQSQSCSNITSENSNSSEKKQGEHMRAISSDSEVSAAVKGLDQKMLYSAIESLCKTVGQLSSQLKDLICKMQDCQE